jgi:hypothetical protein
MNQTKESLLWSTKQASKPFFLELVTLVLHTRCQLLLSILYTHRYKELVS